MNNVERGRDAPSWELVAFYEEAYPRDGQLWSTYVEVVAAPRRLTPPLLGDRPKYPIAGDKGTFITDVTIPDGSAAAPKQWPCAVGGP